MHHLHYYFHNPYNHLSHQTQNNLTYAQVLSHLLFLLFPYPSQLIHHYGCLNFLGTSSTPYLLCSSSLHSLSSYSSSLSISMPLFLLPFLDSPLFSTSFTFLLTFYNSSSSSSLHTLTLNKFLNIKSSSNRMGLIFSYPIDPH